jgi:hypothetical protein
MSQPFFGLPPLKIIDDVYESHDISPPGGLSITEDKSEPPQLQENTPGPIWFHRTDPTKRTDGVLYVPYENENYLAEGQTSKKNICWYFVMDSSGSMDSHVYQKNLTRWHVAVKLLQKVIEDLKKLDRKEDTITIFVFATEPLCLLENVSISDCDISSLEKIRPQGSTDISSINYAVYNSMMQNKLLTQKTHIAAEILFTDGEPTSGMVQPHLLKLQKESLYVNIQKAMNGSYPFFWCGGISSDARLDVIKALSAASPHALWAFIPDEKIEHFAAEIGGVVAMITNMKLMDIPVYNVISHDKIETKSIMLLPDTPSLFYFKTRPMFSILHKTETVAAEHFVSLFKMNEMLYLNSNDKLPLEPKDLEDILQRAKERRLDQSLENLPLWKDTFYKTQQNIYNNIQLLEKNHQETQISQHRTQSNFSQKIQQSSQDYITVYHKFDQD